VRQSSAQAELLLANQSGAELIMSIHQHPPLLLRRPEVERLTGKSRTTIYTDVRAGRFPAPIRTGQQSVAWLASEVDAWLAARVAERDSQLREAEVA